MAAQPKKPSELARRVLTILLEKLEDGIVIDLPQNTMGELLGTGRLKIKVCLKELENYKIIRVFRSWGKCNSYELCEDYEDIISGLDE